jgi:hypothetical protein
VRSKVAPCSPSIVGRDALNAHPALGEPDRGIQQGTAGGRGALVRHVGHAGQAGGIVDDDLEVVVTHPQVTMPTGALSAEEAVPTARRDADQLLVALLRQRPGMSRT